jgi:hypothetical protein
VCVFFCGVVHKAQTIRGALAWTLGVIAPRFVFCVIVGRSKLF